MDNPNESENTFSAEEPKKKSKLWIWILLGVGVVIVLPLGCCGGCVYFGITSAKKVLEGAPVYTLALEEVQSNATCREKLGENITGGMPSAFDINDTGNTGNADCRFSVTGSEGSATVTTKAEKVDGQWRTTVLDIQFDDGTSLDLME